MDALLGWMAASLLVSTPALAGFTFSGDCEGDGEFSQYIPHNAEIVVGTIPSGMADLEVTLDAGSTDVDVQLETVDGVNIIAWPSSILGTADELSGNQGQICGDYKGVEYCYSGFNGIGGLKGRERITIRGVVNVELVMKAYGYRPGGADVTYEYANTTCKERGTGSFAQYIPRGAVVQVGDIPSYTHDLSVELIAEGGRDLDVQLYHGSTSIIAWPNSVLGSDGQLAKHICGTYLGLLYCYSGYNGIGGNWGHEEIDIVGTTNVDVRMTAYGYASGTADVDYSWGSDSIGEPCGPSSFGGCDDGLTCKGYEPSSSSIHTKPGTCHVQNWCYSDATASEDCAALPGSGNTTWGCDDYQCVASPYPW